MTLELDINGHRCQVEIEPAESPNSWAVRIDGKPVQADAHLVRPGVLSLLIEGKSYRIVLDPGHAEPALHLRAQRIPFRIEDTRSLRSRRRHGNTDGPMSLKASMPGRVVRVLVEEGDGVAAHQGMLVIEAMKMQNELKSPKEGRVVEIRVSPGDTVAAGDILAVIE
ncbi:MAG TPA: biotin/lipoyl-containing protein [Acidobacteriaceae bacterium]|nr:biotin/lipoyl-containing protein [Acidobacteriaceae bacterium]